MHAANTGPPRSPATSGLPVRASPCGAPPVCRQSPVAPSVAMARQRPQNAQKTPKNIRFCPFPAVLGPFFAKTAHFQLNFVPFCPFPRRISRHFPPSTAAADKPRPRRGSAKKTPRFYLSFRRAAASKMSVSVRASPCKSVWLLHAPTNPVTPSPRRVSAPHHPPHHHPARQDYQGNPNS